VSWIGIIVTFALVDNVVLGRMLGVCPCVSAPRGMRVAVGIGVSTALLMGLSALAAWALDALALRPLGLGFLRTPVYVASVAGLAFFLQAMVGRLAPTLARSAGFSLPAVGINCATLGAVLLATQAMPTALGCLVAGLASGAGFLLVLVLMTAIRERLEIEQVPRALRGLPLHLISAGLLAYAFMAFDRAFLAGILGG
jgi:electron transport complex protein RnfA